jgi:hypothetical protein
MGPNGGSMAMDSVLIHSSVHKSLLRPESVKSLHYFCSTMQGSRSVSLTNGSGWPKNLWILRTLLKALSQPLYPNVWFFNMYKTWGGTASFWCWLVPVTGSGRASKRIFRSGSKRCRPTTLISKFLGFRIQIHQSEVRIRILDFHSFVTYFMTVYLQRMM